MYPSSVIKPYFRAVNEMKNILKLIVITAATSPIFAMWCYMCARLFDSDHWLAIMLITWLYIAILCTSILIVLQSFSWLRTGHYMGLVALQLRLAIKPIILLSLPSSLVHLVLLLGVLAFLKDLSLLSIYLGLSSFHMVTTSYYSYMMTSMPSTGNLSSTSDTLRNIDSNLSQIKFMEQMKQQREIYDGFINRK